MLFAVKADAVAMPAALVVAVAVKVAPVKAPLGPVAGAVNVTVTPLTGLFEASFTVACNCAAKAVFTVALCGVPAVAVILAAGPARFVREKLAGEATPETEAVTAYVPEVPLAVKTADIATPRPLVVAVVTPPASVPLAPLPGAVNVTVAPLTGLLPESFTVA